MSRRLHVTGVAVGAAGGRVFTVASMGGIPQLTDITAAFAWAPGPVLHYFYEIGDVTDLDETFAVGGPPPPVRSALPGGGTYWVPCSTHPPGPGIWPNGATKIDLTTTDRQRSGKNTGNMKTSNAGRRVWRATDLVIWIPLVALAPGGLGVPSNTTWTVDF